MNYLSQTTIRFPAGHTLDTNEWCGIHPHGHRYTVIVTFVREGFPVTDHDDWIRVREKTLSLALELKDRDLGKMIGAQVPNVFGVASFFMDRLAINVPVTRIEVHQDDDPVAIIERTTDY